MMLQNSTKKAVSILFLAAAFLLFTVPSLQAVLTCGTIIANSGTCTGGFSNVQCASLAGDCCQAVSMYCEWDCIDGTACECKNIGPSQPDKRCSDFDDNEEGCSTFGCRWEPTALGLACGGNSGSKGYGETCGSTSECASCLVCESGKCTQRPGVCTTIPEIYVAPLPDQSTPGSGTGIDPISAIRKLEAGDTSGTDGKGAAVVGESSGFHTAGWFSNWEVTGLIGVAIVCFIIALAAMLGTAFNLPAVKAFANNELKQAVISVLLIVSLVGLVTFFDLVAKQSIDDMDLPIPICGATEPCYVSAAKYYLTTLEDTGDEYAKNQLNESINLARRASLGYSINLNQIVLLFYGMTIRLSAGDSLNAERHGAMFTQMSKILVSISAQKYFIDVITFGIAPLFILLGIVLRTFFFTRKLGGLLLAIAIALFIVYPLTYAFAWYTLNVTVYGERTMASNSDPSCPSECTGTYPAAFFTNELGELVQFPTVQSIVSAGINKNNFDSGAFPGLVSCRNLTSIGITANSCPDCPDYCRDVPFPGLPGCNITSCASCNPGCKIVRQRLTCQTDPLCEGKCPMVCRTRIPLENKCFSNESGGIIPADLSVSCAGCSKYPSWCRFLKNDSGVLKPVYPDDACKSGSVDVSTDSTCPQQCSYITSLGSDTTCDSVCSYTNLTTGMTTQCPDVCRVENLLADQLWSSTYDITPPNLTNFCNLTVARGLACAQCAKNPGCMINVPLTPPPECAGYPATGGSNLCLDCPDYCRRSNFTNFFTNYSNVDRDSDNIPAVCQSENVKGMNCSSVGSPQACNETCKMNGTLLICRTYNWDDPDPSLCRHCPELARFNVSYNKSGVCPGGAGFTPPAGISGGIAVAPSKSEQVPRTIALSGSNRLENTIRFYLKEIYISEVKITPINPTPLTSLQGWCTSTIDDPVIIFKGIDEHRGLSLDGGLVNFNYTWYLNGAQWGEFQQSASTPFGTSLNVDTIPSSELSVGQEWSLWCQAYNDTARSVGVNSAPVTISVVFATQSANISPDPADNNTPLSGYCQVSSPTSKVSVDYKWYRNSTEFSNGSASGIEANMNSFVPPQIPTASLNSGDTWTFSCRGDNGGVKSAWLNSSDVKLKSKGIEMRSSSINPSVPYTSSTLTGSCMATSPDPGAYLSYEFIWYRNDSIRLRGANSAFLQGTVATLSSYAPEFSSYYGINTFEANETWIFSCRAYVIVNGFGNYSEWLNSSAVKINHLPPEPNCTTTIVVPSFQQSTDCSNCNGSCMGPTAYLPNPSTDPACGDATTAHCPYGCRVRGSQKFMDSLDLICSSGACIDFFKNSPQCFINLTKDINGADNQSGPVCSEFIGYGNASCHSSTCAARLQSVCAEENGVVTGCEMINGLCDNIPCTSIKNKNQCIGACQWLNTYDKVLINARIDPGAPLTFYPDTSYTRRTACAQCPEQCRVDSYGSNCGIVNNTGTSRLTKTTGYVDCSLENCPYACRIPQPLNIPPPDDAPSTFQPPANPKNLLCSPYSETTSSCLGCPALCRRSSNILSGTGINCPDSCQMDIDPSRGCVETCLLPDSPEKMCEGCLDCDFECLYYPSVRSSCTEVCSDESLAGPVNIEPNDFIKSLPGAQTAYSDVKGVGLFFVPAVVLPLFCIVIVVSFVRGLSPILGGDIEIPGLGRII